MNRDGSGVQSGSRVDTLIQVGSEFDVGGSGDPTAHKGRICLS